MTVKFGVLGENNDGRRDIIIKYLGQEGIVIRQELYEAQGLTYEQMQNTEEISKFLAVFALLSLQAVYGKR